MKNFIKIGVVAALFITFNACDYVSTLINGNGVDTVSVDTVQIDTLQIDSTKVDTIK